MIHTLGPREVNADIGLCRGDHSALRDRVFGPDHFGLGLNPTSVWIESFEQLYELAATRAPLQLSGARWYHHCAVRGVQGDTIWIANSAPGYKNCFSHIDRNLYQLLGTWRATWVR